jgi:hypothetical protein
MKHYRVEQGTPEWFSLKAGVISASNLKHIMAKFGQAFGDPAKKYAKKLAIEQITDEYIHDEYFNSHMDRGHIDEPIAKALYEKETFSEKVEDGGFFCSDILGYSPDGLLGYRPETDRFQAAIEIKSRNYGTHYNNVERGSLPPEDKWQCIGGIKFAELEWLDYISYCGDFPERKKIFIHRVKPEDCKDEFRKIDERIFQFLELVKSTKETILNSKYI